MILNVVAERGHQLRARKETGDEIPFRRPQNPNEAEVAAIRPRKISVVTVKPGDTVARLAQRMAYPTSQVDRFLTLNALSSASRLKPGQRVKIVVYG